MLDDGGVADESVGIEEAQRLPEGQVPGLHREDRPNRFIGNLRRLPGDRLGLEISFPGLSEVAGVQRGLPDFCDRAGKRLAHLGRDQASIGFRPPVQQVSEPSEKGPPLVHGRARPAQPSIPSSLKADVCFRLVVLRIASDELTCCGIVRLKRHAVLLIIMGLWRGQTCAVHDELISSSNGDRLMSIVRQ
jgi:hypothetical protein